MKVFDQNAFHHLDEINKKALSSSEVSEIKSLISNNEIEKALNILTSDNLIKRDLKLRNEAIFIKQKWNQLKKDKTLNLLTQEQVNLHESKLVYSLITLIS